MNSLCVASYQSIGICYSIFSSFCPSTNHHSSNSGRNLTFNFIWIVLRYWHWTDGWTDRQTDILIDGWTTWTIKKKFVRFDSAWENINKLPNYRHVYRFCRYTTSSSKHKSDNLPCLNQIASKMVDEKKTIQKILDTMNHWTCLEHLTRFQAKLFDS